MAWRWASASVIGTSHIQNGDRLQDAYFVSELGNGCIFAVVSDGAGSAKFGAFGAWLTCRFLSVRFREWMQENPELPSDEGLVDWVDELRDRISTIATRRGTVPRQFAATLAAIIVAPDEAVTLHIGDSSVVGRKGGEWDVLCWPENGEYASSTYFVTDDPEPRLNITRHQREHDAFALFSDGVGDLALSHLEQAAHPRFFDPMLRPVDAAPREGRLVELSAKLATYLAGPSVCERTDDDKTLILISGG
ncbi:PP2C family serine/threonine-protein phosphatase [Desulforhopalus sp. IMCC35007]|uniref:PP2C family serine/threonine-protein phosphatase n=1 Tax=Desulforhopalus sp. IMCC35007 TaxID=2569543 RepID=UPI0010ADE241|nr:PP2C family serine/threonine-protein phosphatase [Desulforhopalus sp. IMCC35007]TKB11288.1 protein phosphatase 2C domain-containing protein [Desulforhopalus sp. IMCC35007]